LAVPLGVIAHPPPKVFACILEGELGLPAQFCVGAGRIGSQIQHITCSSAYDLIVEGAPDNLAESVDHLKHSAATSRAQIPGSNSGSFLTEVIEGREMASG
jgi:hypothetical protein